MWVDGACIARRQESPAHRVIAGIALACALLASGLVTACGQSKTPEHATAAPYDSGKSEAPHALQLALIDPDREVRRAAIARLAARGGDESARQLAIVQSDDDPRLRRDAVHALGEIGGAISTRVLRQALLDEDPAVRQAAAELLEQASAMPGH
jgi:HEAT repeat protein